MQYFEKVRQYVTELGYEITSEDWTDHILVINKPEDGISNLVLDCEDPILIIEQFIFEIKKETPGLYKTLLMKNRDILHGAFVLDDSGNKVLFRDTLALENLDLNELKGSINSLRLLLTEYYEQIIAFAKAQ